MMNFVTSVFKRYMGKNETKTEINKNDGGNTGQSKNEAGSSEGSLDEPSFSSSKSLSEKQTSEPNLYFEDAQENPTVSNVSSEMYPDNRDDLITSDSKGKVCEQIPDILCDTSTDETILHRYDVSNKTTDGQGNLITVLPHAELDLLNTILVDSLDGSDSSSQKLINNIHTSEPASQYEDLNSNNNTIAKNCGSTGTNKSGENITIGNKLVSLTDILDNSSVPATGQPSESNLDTIINNDATSECVAKPKNALKALIHSVTNTFVMESLENEEFSDATSHSNRGKNNDLGQTQDKTSETVTTDLVQNIPTDAYLNNLTKMVVQKSDQEDFARENIENDITDENGPGNIIESVADEVKNSKTELQIVKIQNLEKATNINENSNNCKELDAENRYEEQIPNRNISTETHNHEKVTHKADNTVEVGSTQTKSIRNHVVQSISCEKRHKIIHNDGKTSRTSLKSDKLKEKDFEINNKYNDEVKVLGGSNLEYIASEIIEVNITENQNKPPSSNNSEIMTGTLELIAEKDTYNDKESTGNQSEKDQIFDDLSTILEESMTGNTSISNASNITGVEKTENTNNSNQNGNLLNSSDLEKIEVKTADNAFSRSPKKYECDGSIKARHKSLEQSTGVSSSDTEEMENINANRESPIVSKTHKSINPDTENIQSPTQSLEVTQETYQIMDGRRDTEEFNIIEQHSNENIIVADPITCQEEGKFCRIYERQDTLEFENLERQFEERNLDVNKLQTAIILEKLISESNSPQQSTAHRIEERVTTSSECIDNILKTVVGNIDEIQCVDSANLNIFHRQDTLEFERFEKQFKEEECHQPMSNNILEELVAKCTGANDTEDNTVDGNIRQDEGQNSLKTEITRESNTENELVSNNENQKRSSKCNDEHVKSETKKQNEKDIVTPTETLEKIDNNIKDIVKPKETHKSSQVGSIQPLINEHQNRNEELTRKVDLLQQELDTIRRRNKRKEKQTLELEDMEQSGKNIISVYKNLLDEYEKQIVQQDNDLVEMKVKCEENVRRFTTTEMAFSDVFEKYEKAKYAITVYRKNEDALLENIQNAEEQLSQVETKCLSMKQQAAEQISRAREQVEREKAKHKREITKLQVQVKMLEIKAASLETALTQKSDECRALAAFCEDITGSNSTRA